MKAAKDFAINVGNRRIHFKKGDKYEGKDVQRARHLYQRGMITPRNKTRPSEFAKMVIAPAPPTAPEPTWSVPTDAAEGET